MQEDDSCFRAGMSSFDHVLQGGIAYILEQEYGIALPKELRLPRVTLGSSKALHSQLLPASILVRRLRSIDKQ